MITPLEAIGPYRKADICVLPTPWQQKRPTVAWEQYQTRLPTDEEYQRWFGGLKLSGYWILCGAISGMVGLDADSPAGIAWAEREIGKELLEKTTCVKTARGFHWYFRLPAGQVVKSWKGDGIELHGEGSGLVAPPSMHARGVVYKFIRGLDAMQPLPESLLTNQPAKPSDPPAGVVGTPGGLAALLAAPAAEGGRNDWLTKVAGHLAKREEFRDGYIEQVRLANKELKPPLDDKEWRGLAASIWKAEKSKPVPARTGVDLYTDRGNARRFARLAKGQVYYVPGWGWRVYDAAAGTFVEDECLLMGWVHAAVDEVLAEAASCPDAKAAKPILAWGKASCSASRLKAVLEVARSEPALTAKASDFDRERHLLNVRNGVLDLRTQQLMSHGPQMMMTRCAGVEYVPDARSDLWERHLEMILEGDQELIRFLQRWAGRCLSGMDPSDNCRILMAHGTGANGKTITIETLSAVLGDYAGNTDFTTWCTGGAEGGGVAHPELARLAGLRLVTATESGHTHRLDEALLKLYTGGEEVSPRMLYQSAPVVYRPQFSLLMSTNHLPRLEGSDVGFWRRFLKFGFDYTIPEPDQDARMLSRLMPELSGVLNWALEGYRQWMEIGLEPPLSVQMGTAEYRADIDIIGQFIDERLVAVKGAQTPMSDVYADYQVWAAAMGIGHPLGSNNLSARLKEHGLKRAKDGASRRSLLLDVELAVREFSALGIPL